MFRIVPNPTFKANINLTVPGQEEPAVVEVEFRHKGRAALKAWLENAAGKTDADLLDEVIVSLPLADEDGKDVPYTVKRLQQMLDNYPAAAREFTEGYVFALTESRAKNSGGSLAA